MSWELVFVPYVGVGVFVQLVVAILMYRPGQGLRRLLALVCRAGLLIPFWPIVVMAALRVWVVQNGLKEVRRD